MIKSMTGFGKASLPFKDKTLQIEIRSLNSKQIDLSLKLPSLFRSKELEIRAQCAKFIERGKADVSIYFEQKEIEKNLNINTTLAKAYYHELKKLAIELQAPVDDLLTHILKLPEVLKAETEELNEQDEQELKNALHLALQEFSKFREAEGKNLEAEFSSRISTLLNLLQSVELLDKERATAVRNRIEKNIEELINKERIDQNRLEQEMIYYLEKMDITEEKLRLKVHCDYFIKTMLEEDAVGRKLGFITQEIGREINTIGSKANDSAIQKIVVQMKDELEKIKEQLLNVL